MASNKPTPPAASVLPWLRSQLGPRALAPLTSTDTYALQAAVQIARLWANCDEADEQGATQAFRLVVLAMQDHCREFAYHAIAHVADWSTRGELWRRSGLPHLEPVMHCKFDCP